MTPAERNAKRINREIKLHARLAANATRIHPPTDRETRQQVRREGRELEARMARRQANEARKQKQRNRPRVGQGVEEAREAARNSRGWFKRHENLNRGFKKSGRAA